MNTSPCSVDMMKLNVFNRNYIDKELSTERGSAALIEKLRQHLLGKYGKKYQEEEKNLHDLFMKKVLLCYKDRINNLLDLLIPDMEYLWLTPNHSEVIGKIMLLKIPDSFILGFKQLLVILSSLSDSDMTQENLGLKLRKLCEDMKLPYAQFMRSLRVLLTGQKDGPGITEILIMLEKKRSIERISAVVENIDKVTLAEKNSS
ncbi:putative glutamate--tRNA ligase, mitochondrial, partial [Stegodyphus mimosarum]